MRIEDYIISEDRLIGSGAFGKVYRFGNTCLKLFNFPFTGLVPVLNKYSLIKTNNFCHIKKIFYEDENISGYTMDYYKTSNIRLMDHSGRYLIENIDLIRSDIDELTKNGILLNDLNIGNFIIGDRINIIDPDLYVFSDSLSLYDVNNRYFLDCLKEIILKELAKDKDLYSSENREIINSLFHSYSSLYKIKRDEEIKSMLRR